MAIDIENERLITVKQAQDWLAARGAEKPYVQRVYEWMRHGWLRSCKIGGKIYTSIEALQEMANRDEPQTQAILHAAKQFQTNRLSKRVADAHAAAEAYLSEKLNLDSKPKQKRRRPMTTAETDADAKADADLREIGWA